MDHLPLPSNPTIGHLDIPFLCTEEYDGGVWEDYPERNGWQLTTFHETLVVKRHGASVSDQEFGGFLQTWLYIGLLSATVGGPLVIGLFRSERGSAAVPLFSSAVLGVFFPQWTEVIIQYARCMDQATLLGWHAERHPRLSKAKKWLYVIQVTHKELAPICMSIAALGEYLFRALEDIICGRGLQGPGILNFRTLGADFCDILIQKMLENGWCVSKIAGFDVGFGDNSSAMSVGRLWFVANMVPPLSDKDHNGCTRTTCNHMLIEEQSYEVLHQSDSCSCLFVGPPPEDTIRILEDDKLPLVSITDNSQTVTSAMTVSMQSYKLGIEFVAISHVWSDGHGNPFENSLPCCFLKYLSDLVNKLPKTSSHIQMPFWLDTICVPRTPKSAKKLALLKLKDPYVSAAHVLVLDSYLTTLDSRTMGSWEIVAHVQASGWMHRLWTLQEGRLNSSLRIQFADRAVDISTVLDQWHAGYRYIPSIASHSVEMDIMDHWSASRFGNPQLASRLKEIRYIRQTLSFRKTSRKEDEALCLASILDLDLSKILATTEDKRMLQFWKLVHQVSSGLAFSQATHKLCEPGYRWAPVSFMGDTNVAWAGPDHLNIKLDASSSSSGLLVKLWSFRFVPLERDLPALFSSKDRILNRLTTSTTSRADEGEFYLYDQHGEWYRCEPRQDWHENAAPVDLSEDVAILIEKPLDRTKIAFTHDALPGKTTVHGIFVTIPKSSDGRTSVQVTAHRHVTLAILSPKEILLLNHLRSLVEGFAANYTDDDPHEVLEASYTMCDICHTRIEGFRHKCLECPDYDLCSLCITGANNNHGHRFEVRKNTVQLQLITIVQQFFREDPEVLQLVRELLEYVRKGEAVETEEVIENCVGMALRLARSWKWSRIEQASEQLEWCID